LSIVGACVVWPAGKLHRDWSPMVSALSVSCHWLQGNEDGQDEDSPVTVGGKRVAPGSFEGWSDEEGEDGRSSGKGKGCDGLDDVEAVG
jgi:hypothetical protein